MKWAQVSFENFRNFAHKKFELTNKTIITGLNGSGKSNFIEALRLLTVGKSFKTNHLDEVIKFNHQYFRLNLRLFEGEYKNIELFYGKPFKQSEKIHQLIIEGQVKSWSEFWGEIPSVIYSPRDIDIVIAGPVERRRYLDGILWQLSAQNRYDLLELNKVLRERSTLLYLAKTNQAAKKDLGVWTELLNNKTKIIRQRRLELVEELRSCVKEFLNVSLIGNINLEYFPHNDSIQLDEEIRLAKNLIGAQKDRLDIFLNNFNSRHYASRGQSRLIALTLRLSEARVLSKKLQKNPLMLLDDLMSEIDGVNLQKIIPILDGLDKLVVTAIEKGNLTSDWQELNLNHAGTN